MKYLDTIDPSWKFQHHRGKSALQYGSEILSSLRLNFNQGGDSFFNHTVELVKMRNCSSAEKPSDQAAVDYVKQLLG